MITEIIHMLNWLALLGYSFLSDMELYTRYVSPVMNEDFRILNMYALASAIEGTDPELAEWLRDTKSPECEWRRIDCWVVPTSVMDFLLEANKHDATEFKVSVARRVKGSIETMLDEYSMARMQDEIM